MKRHLIYIIGLLCLPLWTFAQTDGYDPDNPPQPNWEEDVNAVEYLFTAEAIPTGAYSFSSYTQKKVKAGQKVSVSAYDNGDNIFQEWKDANGNTLTTKNMCTITMPEQDITIYAVYSYNPNSPANPEYVGKYLLSLKCDPAVAGSFNIKDKKVTEGQTQHLYAYCNSGFRFVNWTNEKDEVVGTTQSLDYLMPSHASTLTAHYVYEPDVPLNPGTNLWDASLGELSMDFFTPGSLNSAMTKMVGGSGNRSLVTRLLIDGQMTTNDFQFANYFSNLVYIDMSRVGGITSINSSAFANKLTALQEIELPDGISVINSYAFKGCASLKYIDCYALTPPTLKTDVFDGVPEGLTVFVPEASVDLYQAADGWKNFTILPLKSRICEMEVTLPAGDYKNLSLEIVNVKSGQKYKYVVTDHKVYTFPNLIRSSTYRVYVKTASGKVLVQTENVVIEDEVVKVNIPAILLPSTASLLVRDAQGNDVTSQVTWNWYDGCDNLLGSKLLLSDLVVGDSVYAVLTLSESLAKVYQQPDTLELKIKKLAEDYVLSTQLQAIPVYNVKFGIKGQDGAKLHALPAYTITVDELFAGKYHVLSNLNQSAPADYRHQIHQVPTVVTVQAQGYAPKVDTLLLDDEDKEVNIDYVLQLIENQLTGDIAFTYQTAALEGTTGEVLNHYANYASVSYSVTNNSTGKTVTDLTTLYPQMVINSGASIGDELAITAHSNNGDFDDQTITVTVPSDRHFNCLFPIVQKGGIEAKFSVTDNTAVKALLFDADNKLVRQGLYANFMPKALTGTDANDLTFEGLSEGTYTLITLGDSKFFSSLFDLSKFSELGLQQGVDYVKNELTVVPGVVKKVHNAVIPLFQESKFYYTGSNTSFAANKANIIMGNYLTLNARLDFLQEYNSQVSEVELVFPLPESCDYVDGSLIVGKGIASPSQYQYDDHALTVQMGDSYTERVKFCVVPLVRGNFTPTAYVRFKLNDKTILQPIGTAAFTVNDVTMWTPALVSKPELFINGNAPAFSDINIYDGWHLIGSAKALADGYWQLSCNLYEPTNLSVHPIKAEITTQEGNVLQSESRLVEYNELSIQAKTVDMRFYNNLVERTVFVDFDLEHTTTNQPSYMFMPDVEFVFTADLTNNSPEVVDSCVVRVFTNNHEWIEQPAQYIPTLDRWVAHRKFDTQTMPIGVRVEVWADISQDMDEEVVEQQPQETAVYEILPVQGDGFNGYYFNNPQQVDPSVYSGETLEVDVEGDQDVNIYVADDGTYLVEGVSEDNPYWGVTATDPSGARRTQARIDTDVNDLLKGAIDQLTSLAPALAQLTNSNFLTSMQASNPDHVLIPLFIDHIGNTLELSRKVNQLLSYARYGIDDNNDWQQLSDRLLPCDGIDDPQARALNLTAQRYTRLHGLQYYVAVEQACLSIQLLYNLVGNVKPEEVTAENAEAFYNGVLTTSTYILDFATAVYQQNKAASRNHMRWVKKQKNKLLNCQYDMVETIEDHWDFSLPYPIVEPIIDPSGYVYEGVPANRLEGVTATAYYRRTYEDIYGDPQQEVVVWDAENYGQHNPLLTDEQGMYQWDVPQGEWQVKFEKEGYVTAYSEWLPVPPPQLDVNIAMTQQAQPEVVKARAFEAGANTTAGVEIVFSKYMKPATLTTENIFVKGIKEGQETLLDNLQLSYPDLEATVEGGTEMLASKVFIETDQLNQYDEVQVMVNRTVESYAGIQMAALYQQKIDIEKQLTAISADSVLNVSFGDQTTLLIAALPTEAAAGRQVRVTTASTQVATLDDGQETMVLTLDADGQAELTVNGTLYGATVLKMEIVDEDITAETAVNVVEAQLLQPVKAPVASRISGTAVYRGQTVTLACETEGATIYYTTDGTCPCESATRKVYQGPIAISEETTLKTMAIGFNGTESDICEYHYLIRQSALTLSVVEGWNWTSHDLAEALPKDSLQTIATQILTQQECTAIDAEQAMKLKAGTAAAKQLSGDQYNPNSRSILLQTGWNWLGYPIDQMLTLDDALQQLQAEEGDVICNLVGGFAEYVDGQWKGVLQTMAPGQGYLYKSCSPKSFVYNNVATVNARALNERRATSQLPWSVNSHGYPSMMCITAELYKGDVKVDDDVYPVAAFIGNECRGIGQYQNGILYLSVYGNEGDGTLSFLLYDPETQKTAELTTQQTVTFQVDVLGTYKSPLRLTSNVATGIRELHDQSLPDVYYNLKGQRIDTPTRSGLYIRQNKKVVMSEQNR